MSNFPRFNKYYNGEWPYSPRDGVGLKLTGYPTDIDQFLEILHGEICNPVAARRILDALEKDNIKYTTLMYHINFNYVGDMLKELNVKMEIVPPAPSEKLNNQEIDFVVLDIALGGKRPSASQFKPDELPQVDDRLAAFKRSIAQHEHDFGPYDKNKDISESTFKKIRSRIK